REASQAVQLLVAHGAQTGCILKALLRGRGHRVQAQQVQPRHAKMRAGDHIVAETVGPERTSVAYAMVQHPPGLSQVVLVLPYRPGHVTEVARLFAGKAEGDQIADRHYSQSNRYRRPFGTGNSWRERFGRLGAHGRNRPFRVLPLW